jgi:DNA-3-methyladenine glycosylase II
MKHPAIRHLSKCDPVMAKVVRTVGLFELAHEPARSPFQALVSAVAHQQLNGTAANTILKRFIALFPGKKFPQPEDLASVTDDQIRNAGFSRAKVAAIRDIAAKTIDGVVPSSRRIARMPDAEIIERLTSVRGVGQWTVEMLLIFKLGRPDILPAADFGVRNGFRIAYGLKEMPSIKELLAHGDRWRPHRTAAAWYLWRVADRAKKKEVKK